jgi:hypothetical protein
VLLVQFGIIFIRENKFVQCAVDSNGTAAAELF